MGLVEQDPNIRILIVSNTASQAQMFLGTVKGYFTGHRYYNPDDSGGLRRKGAKWTSREIVVRTRTKRSKEATITAFGVRGAVIGRHYDVIICDDIVDNRNSATKKQRDRLRDWFFVALMPCLEPDGKLHVIGTRWHPDDLYGELIKASQFKHLVDTAIMSGGGTVLWPGKFSLKKLKDLRQIMGTRLFDCQFQNNPQGLVGKVFQPDWFNYYDIVPKNIRYFTACDLAISQKENADYFAIVTVGRTQDGQIFVVDAERGKMSFAKQLEMVCEKNNRWHPEIIGVENTAYQDALRQRLLENGYLPVTGLKPQGGKMTRANSLSAQIEFGRVSFRKEMRELLDELLAFPDGANDDYVDALGYAVALAIETDTGKMDLSATIEDIFDLPDRDTINQDNEF